MGKFAMYSIQGDGNRADVELEAATLEEAKAEAREWHESIHLIDGEPHEATVTVVERDEETGDEVRYHELTVMVGSRPS